MSSASLITAIIVFLALLVGYAFVIQHLSNRREQRARLAHALKQRVRNFNFMLNSTPAQFLPKELTLLIQRSLIQVLEQLIQLEPGVKQHRAEVTFAVKQMEETQTKGENPNISKGLENPQQFGDIKACLEELYKFVYHLEGQKTLPRAQAEAYRRMIKSLVLKLTIDSYVLQGRIAQENKKPRLAIHYFELAVRLMVREGGDGRFVERIAQLRQFISKLGEPESTPHEEAPLAPEEAAEKNQISSEWDKFQQEDAAWKKKQIYD